MPECFKNRIACQTGNYIVLSLQSQLAVLIGLVVKLSVLSGKT